MAKFKNNTTVPHYIPRISALVLVVLLFSFATKIKKNTIQKITAQKYINLAVAEPSDIAFDTESGNYFIVSDNGYLSECDTTGKIIRTAHTSGWDFEGVEVVNNAVYVSDESARQVIKYNKQTLEVENTYQLSYNGGRNEGFESLTYNTKKSCFVLISEKNPITIREYNNEFVQLNQYQFTASRDVSSARYFNDAIYLLSDEDRCVLKCDASSYKVLNKQSVNIINPEGICFDNKARMLIAADDIQRLYYFATLTN